MVRAAGKNGRTRRSGTKSRTGRAGMAEAAAVSMSEQVSAGSGKADADKAETTSPEDACIVGQPAACAQDKDTEAEAPGMPSEEQKHEEALADCGTEAVPAERVPGEMDLLRGELLCEELEQNAVEQMFRWMKEHAAGEESLAAGAGEVSGTALLEAVHHGRHVAELSLFLFEALARRFELDVRWARILVQAALWHDLGFAVGGRRRHHKRSMEIIEGNDRLSLAFGLADSDRSLVALLARYHRRAWPSMKHRRFAALSREERKGLCGAAAILRVADALDYRHKGAVEELRVVLRRKAVRIVCFGAESCRKECRRALKKGDFLESLYGGNLEVEQGREGDRDVL